MLIAAILIVFPFAMANAAVSDMLSMTIANRISIILVASFLVLAPLTGMPLFQIGPACGSHGSRSCSLLRAFCGRCHGRR